MSKLYYDINGTPLGLYDDDAPAYPNAAGFVQFDDSTNQGVLDSLNGRVAGFLWQDHQVVGGALQRCSAPLAIAADAPATTDRKAIKTNLGPIFTGLRAGTATNAQVQRVLAFLLRQFLQG